MGCKMVPKSRLEDGLWSTHFSPPAERERRCRGRTGVVVQWILSDRSRSNVIGGDWGASSSSSSSLFQYTALLLLLLSESPAGDWKPLMDVLGD